MCFKWLLEKKLQQLQHEVADIVPERVTHCTDTVGIVASGRILLPT